MSATTHPQFPSDGIPNIGNIVTMEITFWPHGKSREGIARTEKGLAVYQTAISGNECHVHLLNPFTKDPVLIREGKSWRCKWMENIEHTVAVSWESFISIKM